MKKNEKIMIAVLIVIVIIVTIVFFVTRKENKKVEENVVKEEQQQEEYVQVLDDGTKLNKSDKLNETKVFDGLEISNIQLTESNNLSVLLGTITNTSTTTKGGYSVDIKIIDEDENEIVTMAGYISELEPGESTQLNASATFDYANAYDFIIEKK